MSKAAAVIEQAAPDETAEQDPRPDPNVPPAPCPFCGDVEAPTVVRLALWWVTCLDRRGGCGAKGPGPHHSRGEAVAAWNLRQLPAARARA